MRAAALILCAIALVAAGCGGGGEDEKEAYAAKLRPLNDRLIAVSQGISTSLGGVEGADTLGVRFDLQIAQLETVNRNIENLDTPDELRDESDELTRRVRDSVVTLRKISRSVREGKEAASATVELATQAQAVNRAQDRLLRAAGLKKG